MEGQKARNVILLWGPSGTGPPLCSWEETAPPDGGARGLLQSGQMARMDLALYADPRAPKSSFLQGPLRRAERPRRNGPSLTTTRAAAPAFLKTLADLAVKGAAPLASRYLVNREGILVDAGSALAAGGGQPDHPRGASTLIFFSPTEGREEMAGLLGAGFVAALGDVCSTQPFTQESLQALAARLLNELARRCARQLQLTLTAGEDVRDYVVSQHTGKLGAARALSGCCERIFRALSEYCLRQDSFQPGKAALDVRDGVLRFFHQRQRACPAGRPAACRLGRRGRGGQAGAGCAGGVWTRSNSTVFGLADNVQGPEAAGGRRPQDGQPVHAHDLYRQTPAPARPPSPGWWPGT